MTEDDLRTLLLQSLVAPGSSSMPSAVELLASLDDGDPTTSLVASMLARQADAPEEAQVEDDPWPDQVGSAEPAYSERRLLRTLEHVTGELETAQQRNDGLAAALGACYLCWGEDPACEVCAGRGRPGAFEPDEVLYGELVAPAVRRRHRRVEEGVAGPPPASASEGNVPRGGRQ